MAGKLLLADDSVTVQRVIELTFADQGMEVISVGDGAKAIERAEQDRPDIVLADVSMPERDGYEVARHIKRTPHLAHVPVILMTGAFEQVDEARARDVGCDAVLAKPFEPQMVIALVQQLLGEGSRARDAASPAGGADQAPDAPQPISSSTASLDAYLEQLDDALSAAASPGRTAARPTETTGPPAERAVKGEGSVPSLSDAFSALLAEELGESPLPSAWGALASGPAARGPGRRPGAATALDATPPITEEFLDEVARRIGDRLGTGTPGQPPAAQPAVPPGPALPAITPEFVDAVAARVAERLADDSIRDLVSRHVLDVAERLVRDEIERIKAEAK